MNVWFVCGKSQYSLAHVAHLQDVTDTQYMRLAVVCTGALIGFWSGRNYVTQRFAGGEGLILGGTPPKTASFRRDLPKRLGEDTVHEEYVVVLAVWQQDPMGYCLL